MEKNQIFFMKNSNVKAFISYNVLRANQYLEFENFPRLFNITIFYYRWIVHSYFYPTQESILLHSLRFRICKIVSTMSTTVWISGVNEGSSGFGSFNKSSHS